MPPRRRKSSTEGAPSAPRAAAASTSSANLGFEAELWLAAEKQRGHMDAAEYKHVVLGLIFLKYISDAFEEHRGALQQDFTDPDSEWFVSEDPADYGPALEVRDEYTAKGVFWVPKEARWSFLQSHAKSGHIDPDSRRHKNIGVLLDDAMDAIERDNPALKGVLPKDYARPTLNKALLGELIDLVGTIGLGHREARSQDILGRVYEYFLGRFASAEGKKGGQFYTPRCVVRLLVEMLAPYEGRVYDPCCGSGGMFVQSEEFLEAHGGNRRDISIYGQESNPTTWKLARMNLAIRGIEANLGPENADSFLRDLHPDLRADYILANPHFNQEDWGASKLVNDARWKFGMPPRGGKRKLKSGKVVFVDGGNANYAWIQHFIHHLAPSGIAGFVLANGSMSSNMSGEGEIRRKIVEGDLVDCMVALPGQLFYNTAIPACLWFLAKNKKNRRFRQRPGEVLFIDARKMGTLIDRVHRELTDADIAEIAGTYHAWRGDTGAKVGYEDRKGFCKSATLAEIEKHGFVLTPGRYVGAEDIEDDGEPFAEKFARLKAKLEEQFAEGRRLEDVIRESLVGIDGNE